MKAHLRYEKSRQKRSKINESNIENTDDSKILLKISSGKSMTIISPSKQSFRSNQRSSKITKKKSKKKHRKEDKKAERKGIILSIKKGMVNVKNKMIEVNTNKQKLSEKNCEQQNTEYVVGEQKSELKLTIKACPDVNLNSGKSETYKVLEKSDSKSSLKLEKRSSSRTDIEKLDGRDTDDSKSAAFKDSSESKVRNGVVITKDKSGKFLAERLPAVKSKKRDNVFESFNDVEIWKVLASPRDRPNDILKLKLSPQKPARLESTIEEACSFNAAKYLDIPVESVKGKGEVSGEDSDVMELLPSFDKENDNGNNNVNDSGIEVLSSSSCNRSNGNSVRSVVNDDNSPTYFNTEDSMFSLDSPLMNRSEHSICHKCGGIIMETNNNAQSPGKCRCNSLDQSYCEMPESPVKKSSVSPVAKKDIGENLDQPTDSKSEGFGNDSSDTVSARNSEIVICPENEKSDGEDSDIMIITFDKLQTAETEEGKSRLRLKLKPKVASKLPHEISTQDKESCLSSPCKLEKSESAELLTLESAKSNKVSYNEAKIDRSEAINVNTLHEGERGLIKKQNSTLSASQEASANKNLEGKENVTSSKPDRKLNSIPAVVVIDEDDEVKTKSLVPQSETSKHVKKKPLFKSKQCANKVIVSSSPYPLQKTPSPLQSSEVQLSKEKHYFSKDDKMVQNKRPLFKKRTLSEGRSTGDTVKKPFFKSQMSVPCVSSRGSDNIYEPAELAVNQNVSSEKFLIEVENMQQTKSVARLCTVGLEDDDSLQEFSGELIDDSGKRSQPVDKAQNSAISFDLYQQQFLSFISNTIHSNKSNKDKHSNCRSETTPKDIETEEAEGCGNNQSRSPCPETRNPKKRHLASDKTSSNWTAPEAERGTFEGNKVRNGKDLENTKVRKVKNKTMKLSANVNKDEKVAGVAETQRTLSSRSRKVNKAHESMKTLKNKTVGKKIDKLEKCIVDTGTCNQGDSKTQNIDKVTDSEFLNDKLPMPCTCVEAIKTKGSAENFTDASCAGTIEKNCSEQAKENTGTIEKSDSLSWLSIFGGKSISDNNQKNKKESPADVMTDLSENLAEINKKIDVSEDDDTHFLDVDNVFQMDNLSSLEPKHEINFNSSKSNKIAQEKFCNNEGSSGFRYKRKQTAKRSGGRFKAAKQQVESDSEYSEESSDPDTIDMISSHPNSDVDFNPFIDSDDDSVKAPPKRHGSRTCTRLKKRFVTGNESFDSDSESKCSETDRLDSESQSSRSKRTKMGRKSCCPCCIGSPRKRSRDHFGDQDVNVRKESYKLPRRHKQFVRSTLRLLQLQEKIHILFLTLFPECADIVTRTNIGTEEFGSLIDDVLSGLEKKESSYDSTVHSVNYFKKNLAQGQFGPCPGNNIEMPFTAPGAASRTSEIDLVNTSGEDSGFIQASSVQVEEQKSHIDLGTSTVHIIEDKFDENTAGKEVDAGNSWQQTTLFSQSSLVAPSSSSLKFENNTITDNVEHMEENSYEGVTSYPSLVSEPSLSFPQESVVATVNAHYNIDNDVDMVNIGQGTHQNFLNHSEPFHSSMDYFPQDVSPTPVVQSEITITLDLNAVRVSLCRSPKSCLEKLQSQIIKLTKYFLPKLEFKNYFYKNIDNLEFLLDLMIEANSGDRAVDRESENESADELISEKWHIATSDIEIINTPIIKEDDTVKVNFVSIKNDSKTEEREPLFVKCSDLFEQEIKSQRESLKKDLFFVEEEKAEDTWKSAEKVLSSLNSLKKMAKRTEMAKQTRRPRDSRLRKRSAEEKRTLFVREKLQNSQNSTFVCNTRTRSGDKIKMRKKSSLRNTSKKRFLSELNLGDKVIADDVGSEKELNENLDEKVNGNLTAVEGEKISTHSDNVMFGSDANSRSEKMALSEKSMSESDALVEEDSILKSGVKNIFELMQPS